MQPKLTLHINNRKIITCLLCIILALLCANCMAIFMALYLGHDFVYGLVPLFHFDLEANIPSFFSALILLFTAVIVGLITQLKKNAADFYLWLGIAVGFVFLAIDEAAGIHEMLTTPIKELLNLSGIVFYALAISFVCIFLFFSFIYSNFLFSLHPKVRNGLLLGGTIYLGGAIGVDMIGSEYMANYGARNLTYALYYTIEELLEMCGVVMFIYSFLKYIKIEFPNLRCHISYG